MLIFARRVAAVYIVYCLAPLNNVELEQVSRGTCPCWFIWRRSGPTGACCNVAGFLMLGVPTESCSMQDSHASILVIVYGPRNKSIQQQLLSWQLVVKIYILMGKKLKNRFLYTR